MFHKFMLLKGTLYFQKYLMVYHKEKNEKNGIYVPYVPPPDFELVRLIRNLDKNGDNVVKADGTSDYTLYLIDTKILAG